MNLLLIEKKNRQTPQITNNNNKGKLIFHTRMYGN